ncbi:ankyrin repeat domain-containing protein SOWAHC-like [Spinachia spinachia]
MLTMASDCTQEAVLVFLQGKGGKATNADLIEHFKFVFPKESQERAAVRKTFKNYVDHVAFVKTEGEVKYVCLKKRFRGSERLDPHASDDRSAAAGGAQPPDANYGDGQVRVPHDLTTPSTSAGRADDTSKSPPLVCLQKEVQMGNRESFKRERRESKRKQVRHGPEIPEISVTNASPLPAEGSLFNMPGPVKNGTTGPVPTGGVGHSPRDRLETEALTPEGQEEGEHSNIVARSRAACRQPESEEEEGGDEGQSDTCSLSGSEGLCSPKGSRTHFIKAMMNSSPQLRRSMVTPDSVYLSSRTDGDSASLVSFCPDDDRTPVALDPLEHEWMMCALDGEWGSMHPLLTTEPSLILRKDFVTGFTCLHWAAKRGKPELIALIFNFAKQNDTPVSADVRSNAGYTPLHVAAMHNHMEVVKLLVGAYSADVEIRDYSGRKACQYLTDNVSVDIQDIIGAYEHSDPNDARRGAGGRWRFSKALQSNLKPVKLLNPNDGGDSLDGEVLKRKSSFSRMKPELQRLRLRTSQIVHRMSFREAEESGGSGKRSLKSRPKTHFFG